MAAATAAYVAWTFALPATPFAQESWYSEGLASFLILVVSAGLGMIAPLCSRNWSPEEGSGEGGGDVLQFAQCATPLIGREVRSSSQVARSCELRVRLKPLIITRIPYRIEEAKNGEETSN
jgi:hypothetical protein